MSAERSAVSAAEELAAWSAELSLDDVPEVARHAACRHLLDGVGVAIRAAREGAAAAPRAVASSLGGPAEAWVLDGSGPLSAAAATLADGALVHALDFDDTHGEGLVHATAVVLPTAFAVGQQVSANGARTLTAAIAGYELICRLGAASPHGFHARGLHATAVCGTLASAAVSAKLLGLDAARTADALGIAGSASGGLLEFLATGASTKQLHPGSAALNGILAARLAAAGASGPATVLEGENGLYAALSARPFDPARLTRELGEAWEVTRITIKPYPACQLMHAALDAAELLRERLAPATVDSIEVEVHPDSAAIVAEPAAEKLRPRSVYDAKFSLPWSLAALLVDGGISVDTYREERLADPEVLALAARIRVRHGPAEGAAADAPARVAATSEGGETIAAGVPCSGGGPARPLSDEALGAKFLINAGEGGSAAELAELILDLAGQPSLTAIHDRAAALCGAAEGQAR